MAKTGYVHILASRPYGTLYVGITKDLSRRRSEHRAEKNNSFTGRYQIHRLVYFETHELIQEAIEREKRIKYWKRKWKIESINPQWLDLSVDNLF
jgi:putative endonuclease